MRASLKWLLERNLGSGVDELASLALRSLAVLPAGVFSVYHALAERPGSV